MVLVWLKFLICAVIILFAGSRLTKYADAIAEKTGLCKVWLGIALIAVITSLPELANGISAVAIARAPDLAVGDILGACMINMFTLAILDLVFWLRRRQSIFVAAKESNVLSARYGVKLLVFTAFALALSRYLFDFSILGISIYSFIILAIYLLAQKKLYVHSKEAVKEEIQLYKNLSGARIYFFFLIAAAAVIAAGSWLPFIGNEIVSVMGWGETFVAVLFLALATTLPEMTVSISALRLGAVGMGIGNLIGSNVFNVMIIFIADACWRSGSLLAVVSPNMIYAALSGALLMGLAYYILKKQVDNGLPSLLIVLLYIFSLFFLYQTGMLS
ncbi:sodium:calcium antiporter [Candidatus Margulisiibacteriota bacterium]